MSIAKIDSVYIPYVYAQEVSREIIGDRGRTALGRMRQDVIAVKRTWKLQTRPMTKTEADDILDYLDSILFGAVDFWIDDFGAETNTVPAYVEIDSEERVQFGKSGTWYNDGRQLTLTIIEQ